MIKVCDDACRWRWQALLLALWLLANTPLSAAEPVQAVTRWPAPPTELRLPGRALQADVPPPLIYLALYRGFTEAERGFIAYLRDQQIALRLLLRDTAGDEQAIAALMGEIEALQPDLIYSFGTTLTAHLAGRLNQPPPLGRRPLLFNIVADPEGAGFTALAAAGRPITGATHAVPLVAQYRTLRLALASQRIGVIFNPAELNAQLSVTELQRFAAADGVTLISAPIAPDLPVGEAVSRSVAELIAAAVDLIYLPSDSTVIAHATTITSLASAAAIPTFSATEQPVRSGGATLGLTSAYYSVGQLAAFRAIQLLRDQRPAATLPISGIDRFTFLVNLPAARCNDAIPPVALLRMAEIINDQQRSCRSSRKPAVRRDR